MRALVVEDDPEIGPDVVRALQAAGFIVDLAKNGEDAWFKGDVEDYDVAILDLGLPRLDGLSVLKKWRSNARVFPVLILSARGDWTEKVEGIEAGADDYVAKPFEMGELDHARPRADPPYGRPRGLHAVGRQSADRYAAHERQSRRRAAVLVPA